MFSQKKSFGFSTKSSRRLCPHRTKGWMIPSKRLLTVLLFVFCFCILAAVVAAYVMVQEESAPLTGRHVVFFIDLTDGLTDEQYDSFRQEFEYRKNSLSAGDWLSIYAIKGDADRQGPGKGVQLFSNWCLSDGSQADFVTSNQKILKKRYVEQFEMPLQAALESINLGQIADTSPILETLLSMARSREFVEATQREVVIFSNLMQNSGALSLYNPNCSFEKLQNRSLWILDIEGLFAGAGIRVYLIPDEKYPQRQQETLTKFWSDYFSYGQGDFEVKFL